MTKFVFLCIALGASACGSGDLESQGAVDQRAGVEVTLPTAEIELTIPVGARVRFENQDDQDHSVTSMTGKWDSGRLKPGESFTYQFKEAGVFEFASVFDLEVGGAVHVTAP